MSELRPEFERAGARLAVVTGTDQGADDFMESVWKGGDLFVDDDEAFKRSLGHRPISAWWVLKPWVIKDVMSFVRQYGQSTTDVTNKKTQMLGGSMVIKNGEVVYVHRETTSFDNGNAKDLLAAVLGDGQAAPPKAKGTVNAGMLGEEKAASCTVDPSPDTATACN
mmetsp:Transcript_40059/g.105924  ORF Transcript_40059/g.105924 Transcript_40059/m.105924 type:complete len:166 (-) Transcript_40059:321-818(-)